MTDPKVFRPAGSDTSSAGTAIVRALERHGVERVFCVPGESYLDVLDALHDSSIHTVVCRQEGGVSYLAEAEGKLTGRPGVAMVTRGPGAANALIGLHQAWQDAVPMILFVGLVPVPDRDRESFQEFDIRAWFHDVAKRVFVIDDPNAAARTVAMAFHTALSGRPGPVVIGLPEDVLTFPTEVTEYEPLPVATGAVSAADLAAVTELLGRAQRPLVITGGNAWTQQSAAALTRWLEKVGVPSLTDWRADGVVDSASPVYAGSLGYGRSENAARMLQDSDGVLVIGTVLGDVATDGFTLRQEPGEATIVANIDPGLLQSSGSVTRHILADPATTVEAITGIELAASQSRQQWLKASRQAFLEHSALPTEATGSADGPARMDTLMRLLVPQLPQDSIVTFGAGNHTAWAHRYVPTRTYPALLSTRNGSMGYSIPSAVAASLLHPDRLVLSVVGDGELMMNVAELATGVQEGAHPLIVVMDNGQYGTIRSHQESHYPGRVSGTQMHNPDFAALAVALGAHGEHVTRDGDVEAALERSLDAVRSGRPALIHLLVDPEVMLPS